MPVCAPHDVGGTATLRLGPFLDLCDRCTEDLVLDCLPVAVQLLEPVRETPRLVRVLREQQLERRTRVAEPARCIDPRREPKADLARIDRGRIHVRGLHQGTQAELLRSRERAQTCDRERSVLTHERNDVRDRRERDEIEMPAQHFGLDAQQCLPELVDDAGPAQLREGIVGGARRHDRTIRQLVARTMVIGDDDVEAELSCAPDLFDGSDAAVDGQDEPAPLLREPLQRLAADAVALVEAARQMPLDVRAELPQQEDCEHGRADPVNVVVAVDADPLAGGDRRAYPLDGNGHVAQEGGIVQGLFAGQEGPRHLGVAVAAPDEHACRDLAEAELLREAARLPVRARTDSPDALRHARLPYERCRTAPTSGPSSCSTQV